MEDMKRILTVVSLVCLVSGVIILGVIAFLYTELNWFFWLIGILLTLVGIAGLGASLLLKRKF